MPAPVQPHSWTVGSVGLELSQWRMKDLEATSVLWKLCPTGGEKKCHPLTVASCAFYIRVLTGQVKKKKAK